MRLNNKNKKIEQQKRARKLKVIDEKGNFRLQSVEMSSRAFYSNLSLN